MEVVRWDQESLMYSEGLIFLFRVSQNKVYIYDTNKSQIIKSNNYIQSLLNKEISKGTLNAEDKDKIISNFKLTNDLSEMKECSFIIEVITIKKGCY